MQEAKEHDVKRIDSRLKEVSGTEFVVFFRAYHSSEGRRTMESLDSEDHHAEKGRTRKRNEEPPPSKASYTEAVTRGTTTAVTVEKAGWTEVAPVEVEEDNITLVAGDRGGMSSSLPEPEI
ncbi:hypothetical protein K2173_017213 [Erythroxylum novogranatense]|uniref:Uncharacterized protein n=1 Tax=Erythroxylum novogranatense TaxID=1862640 RepID=A0AAV8U622_9ROSI|nr:hypothetical protein K2173_017213 [Erythroxylum novogranatense]